MNRGEIGAVWQGINPAQGTGKIRTLKRPHQLEHRVAAPALSIMADLRRGENHTGGDGHGIDQVGDGREIHVVI